MPDIGEWSLILDVRNDECRGDVNTSSCGGGLEVDGVS